MEAPRFVIAVIIFTLLFSTFSYAFTNFPVSESDYEDYGIDPAMLFEAKIQLEYGETYNITWTNDYQVYDINGTKLRVKWDSNALGDGFRIQAQTFFSDKFLDRWDFPDDCLIYNDDNQLITSMGFVTNETVVNYFNSDYNWTHFKTGEYSMEVFFSLNGTATMQDQIDSGVTPVTLARAIYQDTDYNFGDFASWYFDIVSGTDYTGIPSIFNWLLRIVSVVTIIAILWFTRDLLLGG